MTVGIGEKIEHDVAGLAPIEDMILSIPLHGALWFHTEQATPGFFP